MLLSPRRERRVGTADEHSKAGAPGGSSQDVPRLAQLDLSFLAHRDVVRTGSALPAASGRRCLRRQGHNRQLATCFGQFSGLSQRRFARMAGLEDGQDASRCPRPPRAGRAPAGLLLSDLGRGLSHVEQR